MKNAKSITIRRAGHGDATELARLAQLEGEHPPTGEVLIAEVDGEPWAAVELDTGTVVADPFRPSGEAAELLSLRRARLRGDRRRRGLGSLLARRQAVPCGA